MFFTRTHRYSFSIPKDHLKYRLVGNKLTIHNQDFEVQEFEGSCLCVMPQWEESDSTKTLPVTEVELREDGNRTNVTIISRMRKVDAGGPMIMILLCLFLFMGSFLLLYVSKDPVLTISLCSFSLVIFTVFMMRMQVSYFDYIREIRTYIKLNGDLITTDVRRQIFKHKI